MKISLNNNKWVSISTPCNSGIGTQVYLPFAKAAIDCGAIDKRALQANSLFITHGHADHCGSLGSYLSQRDLSGNTNPLRIYAPDYMAADIELIAKTHAKMASMPWDGSISVTALNDDKLHYDHGHGISNGKERLRVLARRLSHKPESYGFFFYDENFVPFLATAFDTDLDGLEAHKDLYMKFPYVICESTMLGPSDICIKHHHLNMEEVVGFFSKSEVLEKIVLMHFSLRYPPDDILLKAALADNSFSDKIILAIE